MTFWCWTFLLVFSTSLIPLSWLVGHAVGMERTTWARAFVFSLFEGFSSLIAMKFLPVDFFLIKAMVGIIVALLLSPVFFRMLLTKETPRALLGAVLITVVSVGGTLLLVLF